MSVKVAIVTVQVPFTWGGAEILAEELKSALIARGCEVDLIALPFKWNPPEFILDQMLAARLVDLSEVNGKKIDRLITLKFPAYFVPHDNKVGWILHQYRQAYELYGTEYSDLHLSEAGRALANEIRRWDLALLPEHRVVYTLSRTVASRMEKYNSVTSEPLYHPPRNSERFYCEAFDKFILAPGRIEPPKRQHLMIEAMTFLPRSLKLVLIGPGFGTYSQRLTRTIGELDLEDRVTMAGAVSEDEKLRLYARCLAVYNGPYEEDYGYVTLEAFFASKPVITLSDSGGPLEFVTDAETGYVIPANAESIAQCLRRLIERPELALRLGRAAKASLSEKNLSWDYVIERLLS
jgi:glycosyltransferase involved in cell wall biosynthesis